MARTDPAAQRAQVLRHGDAPGVRCLDYMALTQWCPDYPTQAAAALEENAQSNPLAEVDRLQGALLLCQAIPDAAETEACFYQAFAVACRQQARSWELRAAMSLSRLWPQQRKRADARALLARIYG